MGLFIVFDLDGTLSDDAHRAHHREQEPPDWDAYSEACVNDAPIIETLQLMNWIVRDVGSVTANVIEIWTGRPESQRENTIEWFRRMGYPLDGQFALRMRPDGDFRKSTEFKRELMEFYGNPDLVLEDQPNHVKFWTDLGICCLLTCRGAVNAAALAAAVEPTKPPARPTRSRTRTAKPDPEPETPSSEQTEPVGAET